MEDHKNGLWDVVPKLAVELVIVGAFLYFLFYSQQGFMQRLKEQDDASVQRGEKGHTAMGHLTEGFQKRWEKQDEQLDELVLQMDQVGDEIREQNRYLLDRKITPVDPE